MRLFCFGSAAINNGFFFIFIFLIKLANQLFIFKAKQIANQQERNTNEYAI